MMKQGHQLLAVTAIYGSAFLAKKYGAGNEYATQLISFVASIPLIAIPFTLPNRQ